MRVATAVLKSVSPIIFSRPLMSKRAEGEDWESMERRVWRDKMHVSKSGSVTVTAMECKWNLLAAAKVLGEKIPGRGAKTWFSLFQSGILVGEPLDLGVKPSDAVEEWIYCHADGQRGSRAGRVMRCFPRIDDWEGTLTAFILNDSITEAAFERHLVAGGQFDGYGSFRVGKGGMNGRFAVSSVKFAKA